MQKIVLGLMATTTLVSAIPPPEMWEKMQKHQKNQKPKTSLAQLDIPSSVNTLVTCKDTDMGKVDSQGDNCAKYAQNTDKCLGSDQYNSKGFSASEMCCACGGGHYDILGIGDDANAFANYVWVGAEMLHDASAFVDPVLKGLGVASKLVGLGSSSKLSALAFGYNTLDSLMDMNDYDDMLENFCLIKGDCVDQVTDKAYDLIMNLSDEEIDLAISYYNVGEDLLDKAVGGIDSVTDGAASKSIDKAEDYVMQTLIEAISQKTGLPKEIVGAVVEQANGDPKEMLESLKTVKDLAEAGKSVSNIMSVLNGEGDPAEVVEELEEVGKKILSGLGGLFGR
jgi:GNAT superfamily N-acetyltransferase